MGIPRKSSRRIMVDGVRYRYLIKETNVPDHLDQRELIITIQELVEKPGSAVQFIASYGEPVLPRDIAYNIRRAINSGWDPGKRSKMIFKNAWVYV